MINFLSRRKCSQWRDRAAQANDSECGSEGEREAVPLTHWSLNTLDEGVSSI